MDEETETPTDEIAEVVEDEDDAPVVAAFTNGKECLRGDVA